jgi:hypothetical protein
MRRARQYGSKFSDEENLEAIYSKRHIDGNCDDAIQPFDDDDCVVSANREKEVS